MAARRRQQGIRVRWGRTGHVPVAADFDGDGRADVAVWRPSTGQWWLRWLLRGSREVTWGQPGDVAVPADYDGNAAVDVAVWRPSTGRWLRRGSPDG